VVSGVDLNVDLDGIPRGDPEPTESARDLDRVKAHEDARSLA
jgi:hypothetical protein